MNRPKCFISYSSDKDEYIRWVEKLASRLFQENIDVVLDQKHLKYGQDLPNFMESSIRDSDFVLLVCTPSFALKSNKGKGGVGYEKMIVTGEIFQGTSAPEKFIPILREGDKNNAIPSYLKSKTYIDFRNDDNFEANLTQLSEQIFEIKEQKRPNTQSKIYPSGASKGIKQNNKLSTADTIKSLISYASGNPFGTSIFSLGMSQSEAADFAVRIYKEIPSERIDDFKKLVSFAKVQVFNLSPFGSNLDMTTPDAIEFAIKTIKEIPHEEIDEFMSLITYAKQMQPFGLGMSQSEAIDYAMNIIS